MEDNTEAPEEKMPTQEEWDAFAAILLKGITRSTATPFHRGGGAGGFR